MGSCAKPKAIAHCKSMSTPTTLNVAKAGAIVLAGTLVAHVLNYGFTLGMARMLQPNDYAVLVTMVALITIVSIPLRTATTIAAKYTPFILREYPSYAKATLSIGIGLLGIYLCLTPYLARWLTIPPAAFLAITPIIVVIPLLSMNMGVIQGMRRVAIFSWVPAAEAAGKFIFAAFFIATGYLIYGALGAISMTVVISCIVNTFIVKREHARHQKTSGPSSHIPQDWQRNAGGILASSIAIALLGNMDVLAAKHFFSSQIAAQYSVLAVITRTLGYGSLIMIPVVFPAMSQAMLLSDARLLLKKGMGITLIISCCILILFAFYPKQIVTLLPGSQYNAVAPYLLLAGIATALWSYVQMFISYFIATDTKRFLMPLICITGLQALGIGVLHNSIWDILTVTTIAEALLLSICTSLFLWQKKSFS